MEPISFKQVSEAHRGWGMTDSNGQKMTPETIECCNINTSHTSPRKMGAVVASPEHKNRLINLHYRCAICLLSSDGYLKIVGFPREDPDNFTVRIALLYQMGIAIPVLKEQVQAFLAEL